MNKTKQKQLNIIYYGLSLIISPSIHQLIVFIWSFFNGLGLNQLSQILLKVI